MAFEVRTVEVAPGWVVLSRLLIMASFPASLMLLAFANAEAIFNNFGAVLLIINVFVVLLFLRLGAPGYRVTVALDGVRVASRWGSRVVLFRDVEDARPLQGANGSLSVLLKLRTGRQHWVPLVGAMDARPLLAERRDLANVIVSRVHEVNEQRKPEALAESDLLRAQLEHAVQHPLASADYRNLGLEREDLLRVAESSTMHASERIAALVALFSETPQQARRIAIDAAGEVLSPETRLEFERIAAAESVEEIAQLVKRR